MNAYMYKCLHRNIFMNAYIYIYIKYDIFIYALIMFRNFLRMIKTDRNMSELWQIVCIKCNFYIGAYVCFIV